MGTLSSESLDEAMQAVLDETELARDKDDAAIDPRVPEARGKWARAHSSLVETIKRAQAAELLASRVPTLRHTEAAARLLRQWRETRSGDEKMLEKLIDELLVALDHAAVDLDARCQMLEEVLRVHGEKSAAKQKRKATKKEQER